jgi:hypothetical protein
MSDLGIFACIGIVEVRQMADRLTDRMIDQLVDFRFSNFCRRSSS